MSGHLEKAGKTAADAVLLSAILAYLLFQFPPRLLLSPTITAGGDTPSHYYTLKYLKETLLPKFQVSGWTQSHYAGFPILQNYFPLPFLIMAALSCAVPMAVAFKIGTVLGIFLLPVAIYIGLRCMRLEFPVPILGAVFALPFLFMEANSMWGGNIPSTLAGEFSYSLGFALTMAWMGTLYHGVTSRRLLVFNAVLLALIGLSHGCTLLFAGTLSLFFLWDRRYFMANFIYLAKMYVLSFLLMGFWLIPFLKNQPWTTPYNDIWIIHSWKEIFPYMLFPGIVLAVPALFWKPRRPLYYLLTGEISAWYLYFVAPRLAVADIRFLPFAQLLFGHMAALGTARLTRSLKGRILIPVIILASAFWWVGHNNKNTGNWVHWNYSGFEGKRTWPLYSQINDLLRGSVQDPRVLFEHSEQDNAFGTPRAWESLPLFAGRSTLEHAYMQASPSSPFVFYLQSETSRDASCPFQEYACASMNFADAEKHLRMFNVREIIVTSDEAKRLIKKAADYHFRAAMGSRDIYELPGAHHYVEPLQFEPVLWTGGNWKWAAYTWFRNNRMNDVFLVFPVRFRREDYQQFPLQTDTLVSLPRRPLPSAPPVLWERVSDNEISFAVQKLHQPYLVKFSFHPNWKVEGAEKIYLVSPSFMLVYPAQNTVRLTWARSFLPDYLGLILSAAGLVLIFILWKSKERPLPRRLLSQAHLCRVICWLVLGSVGGTLSFSAYRAHQEVPYPLLVKGVRYKDQKKWDKARQCFEKILSISPVSGPAEHAYYYLAIGDYLDKNWEPCIDRFNQLIQRFPETRYLPEAYFHRAICYENLGQKRLSETEIQKLMTEFPRTPWAAYAVQRWGARIRPSA